MALGVLYAWSVMSGALRRGGGPRFVRCVKREWLRMRKGGNVLGIPVLELTLALEAWGSRKELKLEVAEKGTI